MKKTLTYSLIIGLQFFLALGFVFVDRKTTPNKTIVSYNDNLFKMADSVKLLYINDDSVNNVNSDDNADNKDDATNEEEVELVEEPLLDANAKNDVAPAVVEEPEVVPTPAPAEVPFVPVPSGIGNYNSKPEMGFNVTTGNKTYILSGDEFNVVSGVIACETGGNWKSSDESFKNDALAVASVILNRADARGMSPFDVVSQYNQFSCYILYTNNPSDYQYKRSKVINVLNDALGGIRNNNYHNFNGWRSGYKNFIVEGGNRFY